MDTKLIVLRGPSGSGKSSVAKLVRSKIDLPLAIVEQDYIRRVLLKEKDVSGGSNIALIGRIVSFALQNGFHVILEGILNARRYDSMLKELVDIHPKNNYFFYFDISFEETLKRHQTKAEKDQFGEQEMRAWYKDKDLLGFVPEEIIPESNTQKATVDRIVSLFSAQHNERRT